MSAVHICLLMQLLACRCEVLCSICTTSLHFLSESPGASTVASTVVIHRYRCLLPLQLSFIVTVVFHRYRCCLPLLLSFTVTLVFYRYRCFHRYRCDLPVRRYRYRLPLPLPLPFRYRLPKRFVFMVTCNE